LAEDALKSVPVFKGGYSKYVGWRMTARRFIKVGYYSEATAFSLLKKRLEGEVKRIVKNLSVEDCYALKDLLQALDDKYGDVDFLAAEERRKITEMKTVSYGARNLLDFCQVVNKARRILEDAGQDVDTKDYVSLVVSRLPRTYQSRLADAMRWKRKKGLDATMQELREIALSKRANEKITKTYAAEKGKKDENKKKGDDKKGDGKRKPKKNSSINSFAANAQQPEDQKCSEQNCPECNSTKHSLGDCKQFLNLHKDEHLLRAKKHRVHFRCLRRHPQGECSLPEECAVLGKKCRYDHHESLHDAVMPKEDGQQPSVSTIVVENREQPVAVLAGGTEKGQSLRLTKLFVRVGTGKKKNICQVTTLIDNGSTATIVREEIARRLEARLKMGNVTISTIGGPNHQKMATLELEVSPDGREW
jgi:hypothetical protein